MVFHPSRIIILLLFVGFLISIQLEEVSSLRSLEIALRQSQEEHRIMLQDQHSLKATEKELLNTKKNSENVKNRFDPTMKNSANVNNRFDPTKKNSAKVNNQFDPNQSSKRRVRKGPDPIHNRS